MAITPGGGDGGAVWVRPGELAEVSPGIVGVSAGIIFMIAVDCPTIGPADRVAQKGPRVLSNKQLATTTATPITRKVIKLAGISDELERRRDIAEL
jgi:hypothetical protein